VWDAEDFVVTSDAQPPAVADLLDNGSFSLTVQPSGQYTAILTYGGLSPVVEFGQLSVVSTGFLRLTPTGGGPCLSNASFTFGAADFLTIEGPTCFDFNLDGTLEAAQSHLELRRR
jgi:hypothetical protein